MMSELRIRPKSDYLHTATLQNLYVLSKHWQSDMDFFKDELLFLKNLVGKYFVRMTKDERLSRVHQMVTELTKIDQEQHELSDRIKKHLSDLELLLENAFSQKEQEFRDEHVQLEDDIADFSKEYRKVKKEVFAISEYDKKRKIKESISICLANAHVNSI